jgi:lipopolysaccharide transport protein LptA
MFVRGDRLSVAIQAEGTDTHAWTAPGGPDFERRVRAAKRHSRHVRILRAAVPAMVILGIVTWTITIWLNPARVLAKLPSVASVGISGTTITMSQPRLEGFTRDTRPYVVTAKSATQDLLQPDRIDLKEIHATMEAKDKTTVVMSATKGLYHSKADLLFVREQITVTSSSGYVGHLTEAEVNMRSGDITSDKPVAVKLPKGMINANHLEVADDVIRFGRGVTFDVEGSVAGHPVNRAKPGKGAQTAANPLQGFDRSAPIKIVSTSLEVREKDSQATFIDNVRLVQGETTIECKVLVVFYKHNDATVTAAPAKSGDGGSQQIERLEARGSVVLTQMDQTATGDTGVFDVKANTATLTGNVVVTQGQNVVQGDKLVANLTTGISRVEASNGLVQSVFTSTKEPNEPAASTPPEVRSSNARKSRPRDEPTE